MKFSKKVVSLLACAGLCLYLVPVFAETTNPPVPGGDPAQAGNSDRGPGGPTGPGGPRGGKGKWKRGGFGGPGGPGGGQGQMFEQADTNGDGKVTKEEFVAAAVERAERMFGNLDADESGDVTKEEIKAARERFEGKGQRGGGPGGRFGSPGGPKRPADA